MSSKYFPGRVIPSINGDGWNFTYYEYGVEKTSPDEWASKDIAKYEMRDFIDAKRAEESKKGAAT